MDTQAPPLSWSTWFTRAETHSLSINTPTRSYVCMPKKTSLMIELGRGWCFFSAQWPPAAYQDSAVLAVFAQISEPNETTKMSMWSDQGDITWKSLPPTSNAYINAWQPPSTTLISRLLTSLSCTILPPSQYSQSQDFQPKNQILFNSCTPQYLTRTRIKMLKLVRVAFAAAILAQAMALPSPNSATSGSPQLASVWRTFCVDQYTSMLIVQFNSSKMIPPSRHPPPRQSVSTRASCGKAYPSLNPTIPPASPQTASQTLRLCKGHRRLRPSSTAPSSRPWRLIPSSSDAHSVQRRSFSRRR